VCPRPVLRCWKCRHATSVTTMACAHSSHSFSGLISSPAHSVRFPGGRTPCQCFCLRQPGHRFRSRNPLRNNFRPSFTGKLLHWKKVVEEIGLLLGSVFSPADTFQSGGNTNVLLAIPSPSTVSIAILQEIANKATADERPQYRILLREVSTNIPCYSVAHIRLKGLPIDE
jgi:hypothetical protein